MSKFEGSFKPKETANVEKEQETEHPKIQETDAPQLSTDAELSNTPFSDSSDIFDAAFKNFGLTSDAVEAKEIGQTSEYIEKGEDGKYYDKGSRKAYDSVEAWKKSRETLAKRYDSTATFYENKAKKEWARFKNAETNGESDSEKWKYYRSSQELYAKSKDNKEKAEKTREALERTNDDSTYSSAS